MGRWVKRAASVQIGVDLKSTSYLTDHSPGYFSFEIAVFWLDSHRSETHLTELAALNDNRINDHETESGSEKKLGSSYGRIPTDLTFTQTRNLQQSTRSQPKKNKDAFRFAMD